MNLPTFKGFTLFEIATDLAEQNARWEKLKRIQAGIDPNTLGGCFPDLRLDEALDDSWQQKEELEGLLALWQAGLRD